jgi:polyisoprenoid-binding protein YceI
MNKLLMTLLSFILISNTINSQSTYIVDGGHSSLIFTIGYNYSDFYGSFGEMEGKVDLSDENDFSTAKVDFKVNISSINTNSKGRDGHLQGERYLNAEKNAAATFVSKHIKKSGVNNYEMTGDLTIAGVTLSQTVNLKITGRGEVGKGEDMRSIMGAEATFSFNRSNFGVKGGIPTMSDKVDIVVSLNLVKETSKTAE